MELLELNKKIPIIIPAYEPDEKMVALVENLKSAGFTEIVVVDDGSQGEGYQELFSKVQSMGCVVLHHAVNQGKGRALKTAFNHCLYYYPDAVGCVTIDSDGQHTVKDMTACMEKLMEASNSLVLGVRDFNQEGIPARSVFGNKTTSRVM